MSIKRFWNLAILAGTTGLAMYGLASDAAEPTANDQPAVAISPGNVVPKPPEIWGTDFHQAKKQSAKLNRPILLHFHARWCAPCQQMEGSVLNSSHVLKAIDTHCVGVKIDSDRYPNLVQQYRVEALPCDVFVTSEGKVLHVSQGVVSASAYVGMISRIAKPKVAQPVEVTGN